MKKIDPQQTTNKIISFLKTTFKTAGFTDAVIAVSGGIDSALSCTLAVKALGTDHVYPLFLPYGKLNPKGLQDAQLVTSFLKIPEDHIQIFDIQSSVDEIRNVCHPVPYGTGSSTAGEDSQQKLRLGNIMARTRMIFVFDQAKRRNALVVGTENKTEHYLGYYTRFGDEASDVEPLRNLYKYQVYELSTYLGIPEPLLTKAPTAGLWEGQTDESEFGFSYNDADKVLDLYIEQKKSVDEMMKEGIDKSIIEKVITLVKKNDFKHHLPFLGV